jgi:hypothetical protein
MINFIDLDNSYIYLKNPDKGNSWRLAIKSVLLDITENTYYYLTKECLAELIGEKPFDHEAKSEFLAVVDSNNNAYCIRNSPVLFNDFDQSAYQINKNIVDGIFIKKRDYKNIDFVNINKKLKKQNLKSLYNKFYYEFQNKKFIIFNKVEYLNYQKSSLKDYLQPIYGYVPFLKDNKIFISYVVSYLEKERQGNLEFRLRTNQKLKKYLPSYKNKLKLIIKRLFFFSLKRIKISNFYEKISLVKFKANFYE